MEFTENTLCLMKSDGSRRSVGAREELRYLTLVNKEARGTAGTYASALRPGLTPLPCLRYLMDTIVHWKILDDAPQSPLQRKEYRRCGWRLKTVRYQRAWSVRVLRLKGRCLPLDTPSLIIGGLRALEAS